jgi:tRNA(Ile2) C34 agmatinyltransferase TiaS
MDNWQKYLQRYPQTFIQTPKKKWVIFKEAIVTISHFVWSLFVQNVKDLRDTELQAWIEMSLMIWCRVFICL